MHKHVQTASFKVCSMCRTPHSESFPLWPELRREVAVMAFFGQTEMALAAAGASNLVELLQLWRQDADPPAPPGAWNSRTAAPKKHQEGACCGWCKRPKRVWKFYKVSRYSELTFTFGIICICLGSMKIHPYNWIQLVHFVSKSLYSFRVQSQPQTTYIPRSGRLPFPASQGNDVNDNGGAPDEVDEQNDQANDNSCWCWQLWAPMLMTMRGGGVVGDGNDDDFGVVVVVAGGAAAAMWWWRWLMSTMQRRSGYFLRFELQYLFSRAYQECQLWESAFLG